MQILVLAAFILYNGYGRALASSSPKDVQVATDMECRLGIGLMQLAKLWLDFADLSESTKGEEAERREKLAQLTLLESTNGSVQCVLKELIFTVNPQSKANEKGDVKANLQTSGNAHGEANDNDNGKAVQVVAESRTSLKDLLMNWRALDILQLLRDFERSAHPAKLAHHGSKSSISSAGLTFTGQMLLRAVAVNMRTELGGGRTYRLYCLFNHLTDRLGKRVSDSLVVDALLKVADVTLKMSDHVEIDPGHAAYLRIKAELAIYGFAYGRRAPHVNRALAGLVEVLEQCFIQSPIARQELLSNEVPQIVHWWQRLVIRAKAKPLMLGNDTSSILLVPGVLDWLEANRPRRILQVTIFRDLQGRQTVVGALIAARRGADNRTSWMSLYDKILHHARTLGNFGGNGKGPVNLETYLRIIAQSIHLPMSHLNPEVAMPILALKRSDLMLQQKARL
jgi:hypothetical protein